MKQLRKKYLVNVAVITAMIALLNICFQFDKIVDSFPKEVISTLMQEEQPESTEDASKENGEFSTDIIVFSKQSYALQNHLLLKISVKDFVQIPSNPFLEKITPPPQG